MELSNLTLSPGLTTHDSSKMSSGIRKRRLRLTFPPPFQILETPNLKATLELSLSRIPDGSEALSPNTRELEQSWNNRFNVTFSKDNHKVYTHLREYFDAPRVFDKGIKRRSNYRNQKFKERRDKRTESGFEQRETMWNTRYSSASEWNEIKHKSMRNYFGGGGKLPKITS